MPLDPSRPFLPIRIAVLTVSDTRSPASDRSGDALCERVRSAGHVLARRALVRDDIETIEAKLRTWVADPAIDAVISTGGTGLTGRDQTPEAFARVIEKEMPGFGELFRMLSYAKIATSTMLSRALGGVSEGTYLFALPGSPSAVRDAWDGILVHQFDSRMTPGNLVDLMPRLQEHKRERKLPAKES